MHEPGWKIYPIFVSCPCRRKTTKLNVPGEQYLSLTAMLQYLVKRKGCNIPDYGLVEMAAAKRQRLMAPPAAAAPVPSGSNTGSSKCPVPLSMIEEYEVGLSSSIPLESLIFIAGEVHPKTYEH